MPARPLLKVTLLAVAVSGATCNQADQRDPGKAPLTLPSPTSEAQAAPPAEVTDIPGVDIAALDPAVRADALRLLRETYSYCGCARSLAACLANKAQCACPKSSERMANFILAEYADGASTEDIETELLEGFSEGYNGRLLKFKDEDQPGKGPKDAKFEMVEFADFRCPHCAEAWKELSRLMEKRKDVHLTYYYFPLAGGGEASVRAAEAAHEAHRQGKFAEMASLLYANPMNLAEQDVVRYAKQIGLDMEAFTKALHEKTHRDKVMANKRVGEAAGVRYTPMLYVNGRPFGLARTVRHFEMRLAMEAERGRCE